MRTDLYRWVKLLLPERKIKIEQFEQSYMRKAIFYFGAVIYLTAQGYLVFVPIFYRSAPVEADDAYTYIIKSVRLESHLSQNIQALNDLQYSLKRPTERLNSRWMRYRTYGQVFISITPVHSVFLLFLHKLGLTWERAYNFTCCLGAVVFPAAVGFWLFRLFGYAGAGLSMMFIGASVLTGGRFDKIVPNEFALLVFIGMLIVIIAGSERWYWSIPFLVLVSVGIHPIGRAYSILGIVIFFITLKKIDARDVAVLGSSVAVLVVVSLILYFGFDVQSVPGADEFKPGLVFLREHVWQDLVSNFRKSYETAGLWSRFCGGWFVVLYLGVIGLFHVPKESGIQALVQLSLLLLLVIASVLYFLPNYPGALFHRTWAPVSILLCGFMGRGLWVCICEARLFIRLARESSGGEVSSWKRLRSSAGTLSLIKVGVLLPVFVMGGFGFSQGIESLRETVSRRIRVQSFSLRTSHLDYLTQHASADDAVLYSNQVIALFSLCHGGMRHGAFFYPGLRDTIDEAALVDRNPRLRFLATFNPMQRFYAPFFEEGGLSLLPERMIEIRSGVPKRISELSIYLENSRGKRDIEIELESKEGKEKSRITAEGGWSGWMKVTAEKLTNWNVIKVSTQGSSSETRIRALRVVSGAQLNWPWDMGISVTYHRPKKKSIDLDSRELFPRWSNSFDNYRKLRVVHDQGSIVLAEITAKSTPPWAKTGQSPSVVPPRILLGHSSQLLQFFRKGQYDELRTKIAEMPLPVGSHVSSLDVKAKQAQAWQTRLKTALEEENFSLAYGHVQELLTVNPNDAWGMEQGNRIRKALSEIRLKELELARKAAKNEDFSQALVHITAAFSLGESRSSSASDLYFAIKKKLPAGYLSDKVSPPMTRIKIIPPPLLGEGKSYAENLFDDNPSTYLFWRKASSIAILVDLGEEWLVDKVSLDFCQMYGMGIGNAEVGLGSLPSMTNLVALRKDESDAEPGASRNYGSLSFTNAGCRGRYLRIFLRRDGRINIAGITILGKKSGEGSLERP